MIPNNHAGHQPERIGKGNRKIKSELKYGARPSKYLLCQIGERYGFKYILLFDRSE